MLSESMLIRIAERAFTGEGCIECGAMYFHAHDCERGLGLSAAELLRRLEIRAKEIESRTVYRPSCHICSRPATGTIWEKYHRTDVILIARPVCEPCASLYQSEAGRESGYVPGIVTNSIAELEHYLTGS